MSSRAIEAAMLPGDKPSPHISMRSKQIETVPSSSDALLEAETHNLSFTQSQLSLALSILRSKPADSSIREYCLRLQKNIKHERPLEGGECRYIDTAEFWKDQYSKIHSENMMMKVRLAEMKTLTDENNSSRNEATAEMRSLGMAVYWQPEITLNGAQSTNSIPLLRQALNLHRLLQDDKVPAESLISAICLLLFHMGSTLDAVCNFDRKDQTRRSAGRNYNTFKTVSATFNICLKGLMHLCRNIPGRRCKGQVIFSLVQFFINALNHLNNICLQHTEYSECSNGSSLGHDSQRVHYEDTTNILTLTSGLSKLLVNILTCPEFRNAQPSYTEVLEGMLAALLEDAGILLSKVVFEEDLSSTHKSGLESSPCRTGSTSTNTLSTELKCQRLAYILKRVLGGKIENDRHSLAAMIIGTKALNISASKKIVLARARQRLQETLLKGVFGQGTEEFINALQIPEREECLESVVPQSSSGERDAFLESVWAIVGWDKLEDN